MLNRLLLCVALVLAFASILNAQQNNGSIKGAITDQLGSLITNARVVLKDERSATTSITTNQVGTYEFKNLRAGKYELRVMVPGFVVYEEKDIQVEPHRVTTVDVQLAVELEEQQVTVDDRTVSTDADNNANAIVLKGRDLEALPNDPSALAAALQALAGPTDPESGGGAQIKVDGFSNGQIPPKESIREVRINNNPYSAENEYPGWNGIEIFTQPGSDKWHGGASFDFNDESLNSRNPFTSRRAPYQQRSFGFNLSGPIVKKRASFSAYLYRYVSDSNSVVNATILDPVTLLPVIVNQSFVTPSQNTDGNARVDFKVNKKHTLVGRFSYWIQKQDLQGIGGFALPSRAYQGERSQYTVQVTETALLNEKTVNETRVQLSRTNETRNSVSALPALTVQEAFSGGGSQIGATSNLQRRFEIQNFTSWSQGKHFMKIGGRLRWVGVDSVSPGNFGGSYTFSGGLGPVLDANDQVVPGATAQLISLERYRRTLLFQRQGLSAAAIRALGGGATQFSIAGGEPKAKVTQADVALYFQDEWRLTPHFTVSPGLRYENQNNIDSNMNFAPRIGFAWSPVFGSKKAEPAKPADPKAAAAKPVDRKATNTTTTATAVPAADPKATAAKPVDPKATPTATTTAAAPAADPKAAAAKPVDPKATPTATTTAAAPVTPAAPAPKFAGPPKTVFRGGLGFFYNRISEDLSLSALRFNGTTQQQFLVTDPTVLDLFPVVPAVGTLQAFAQPQSLRSLSEELGPSRSFRAMFTVERQLTKTIKLSTTYSHAHTFDTMRTVNINAPLGGTFIPGVPTSGVRPLGQSAGNIFQYQATGESVGNSLNVNINGNLKKLNFWGGFSVGKSRNRDNGSSGSAFDAYDFSREWARSGSLSFLYLGGYYQGPHGISLNLFTVANSGQTFNITTGRDTNGDTVFSERPAFATDLNKPGVVVTPLGAFDPNPTVGQPIIPRNFGRGPAFISVNLSAEKVFKFGKAIEPKTPPSPPKTTDANAPQTPQPKPPVQRPYTLGLSIYTSNLFNRTNRGNPVGNMTSPYFLKSPGGSNTFFFGPGGGSGGNRTVNVRVRINF